MARRRTAIPVQAGECDHIDGTCTVCNAWADSYREYYAGARAWSLEKFARYGIEPAPQQTPAEVADDLNKLYEDQKGEQYD